MMRLVAYVGAVGLCLLDAMAETAGPLWTDDLTREWSATYGAVATLMKDGAAKGAVAVSP